MLVVGLLSTTLAAGSVLGAGYWLLKSGKLSPVAAAGETGKAAAKEKEAAAEEETRKALEASKVVPLEPMVVNLSDAGGRAYLRAAISLRIADDPKEKGEKAEGKPDPAVLAGKTAALRDSTLSVLSAQSSDSLFTTDGPANVKKLLRERYILNNPEVHVINVYFTDFLVQRQ